MNFHGIEIITIYFTPIKSNYKMQKQWELKLLFKSINFRRYKILDYNLIAHLYPDVFNSSNGFFF